MKTPKKILNDPRRATDEMMEGLVLADNGDVAGLFPEHMTSGGAIWRQVLAVLYAYGAFLAVLVLAILLRSVFGALATVLIIVLTITSTLGLAGWAGIFLSTATVNVPTFVMTLAVADSVHLIASTQFFMRQGLSKEQAIEKSACMAKLQRKAVFLGSCFRILKHFTVCE